MKQLDNEKLSLFLDNQLDSDQSLHLLKAINKDPALQTKLQRYSLISQAIKNDASQVASSNFVASIREQIRNEPTYLIPSRKAPANWKKTAWAAAASVLLGVSVVTFMSAREQPQPFGSIQTLAQASKHYRTADNARFNEYLQDHDNVWYVNNAAGSQPYARVAGYSDR